MEQERARAKVNLFLRVVGRRADGYHLLDSLAVFAGAADIVRAEAAETLSLRVEGRFGAGLDGDENNLVLRAARALAAASGFPGGAALTLVKELPVASGIGGGSADAAATLRVLRRLWGFSMPLAELAGTAAGLGADVPVCLASVPARMGGIGEVLGVAPLLPAYGMVLVNPGVEVSTPAVFRARHGGFGETAVLPARWADAREMSTWLGGVGNDLEEPALRLCPEIGAVLAWLRGREGCLLARMSGSGATCFGLFANAAAAAGVAKVVPAGWWGWGGEGGR